MIRQILSCLLVIISLSAFAQDLFQAGYIIDSDGKKIECLIKNEGWIDNPNTIQYKRSTSESIQIGDIGSLKEFGVGKTRFIKAIVEIDYSSDKTKNLSSKKELTLTSDTLFIKQLIEGKSSLFVFKTPEVKRFFMQMDAGELF